MADATPRPEPTCDVDGTCYCPLADVVETLSRKYALQLFSVIGAHESLRFTDLEAHVAAATATTLSKRLDELEAAGLVSRTQYEAVPPRVEYALTEDGVAVRERLEPLLEWTTASSS